MNFAAPVLSVPSRRGLSKAAAAYEYLRAEIVELRLQPGSRIDKSVICRALGISRQPLAEAVARLAEERLIDIRPQRGTFVARIRFADVAEANFVRQSLEVSTVQTIAPRIADAVLDQLDANLDAQAEAAGVDDSDAFYRLDVRFHLALFEVLAMRRVAEVVETSRAQLERIRRLLLPKPGRLMRTVDEHRTVFRALEARDGGAAGAAMQAHLDVVMSELRELSTRRPELFEA